MARIEDFQIPVFKYFPTHLMEKEGPKQWARIRFIQACARLSIPKQLWPTFTDLTLPTKFGFSYLAEGTIEVPSFNPLYETEAEWKQRAHASLESHLEHHAEIFRSWFETELRLGRLTRIKPTRDTTPLELRYEWAAKRYCLRQRYLEIASQGYTEARVKQTVLRILRQAGLNSGT